ncbi:MAG: thymidine kinase [Bacteroidota bacterium]
MFIEPHFKQNDSGWIEVICGSMFSGKTEELIRRLKRAQIARQKVAVFKPQLDTRYHAKQVVSHDANSLSAIPLAHSKQLLEQSEGMEVVGIDEAQFFDMDLPKHCHSLAQRGIRVIVAGLDMDFKKQPFGPIPHLLATAEYITKVHAICHHCGNLATYSYRLTEVSDTIMLGAKNKYEARCRSCYAMGSALNSKPER